MITMDMTHPAILHAERTGHPPGHEEPAMRCVRCDAGIYEDEHYYSAETDGSEPQCEDCFLETYRHWARPTL